MTRTDIIICNPPIYSRRKKQFDMTVRPRPPLVLAYIQAILKTEYNSELLDAKNRKLGSQEVINYIKRKQPKIVILTSTPIDRWECPNLFIDSVFEIIDEVTKDTKVILCGTHGTVTPEWIFEKCKADYVVRGEPEVIVKKLVEAILAGKLTKKIKGISWFDSGKNKVINNPDPKPLRDLDKLPFPAYEDIDFSLYQYTSDDIPIPFTIMLSSRGCPFSCTFCLKAMMNGPYRTRKPGKVVKEMLLLQNKFGVKGVYFQDWEFAINKPNVEKLCKLMIKKGVKIKWGCNARATDFSLKLMELMKRAGCVRINIGFESGSQTILDNIKKMVRIEHFELALKIAKKLSLHLGIYTLINSPGENKRTLKETAEFLVRNNIETDIWWNYPIPYFGTQIGEKLKLKKKSWPVLSRHAGKVGNSLTPEKAREFLTREIWRQKYGEFFYLNPFFSQVLWRHIRDVWIRQLRLLLRGRF